MHLVPRPPASPSKTITQQKHSPRSSGLGVSPLLVPRPVSSSSPSSKSSSSHKPTHSPRMTHPPPNLEPPPSSPTAVLDSLVQQSSEPPSTTAVLDSLVQQSSQPPPSPSLVGHESPPAAPPPQLDGNSTHPHSRKHPVTSPPLLSPETSPPPPLLSVQNGGTPLPPVLKPPESSPPPPMFSPPPLIEPHPSSPPSLETSPPPPDSAVVQTAPPAPQTPVSSPDISIDSVPLLTLPPPSNSPPITSISPEGPTSSLPPPAPPPTPPPLSVSPPSSLTHNVSSTHEPAIPSTNHSESDSPQNAVSRHSREFSTGDVIAIALVLGFVFVGLSGAVAFFVWKRKKKVLQYSPKSGSSLMKVKVSKNDRNASAKGFLSSSYEPGGFGHSKLFAYEVLAEATGGFSESNLLGVGGFGSVYKGILSDATVVAVKQLNIGGGQGEREFRAEVEIISRIHHRHLVSLVGYCINDNRRLLVYDYVPNNNLYYHLHGEGMPVLEWTKRVKIAVGSAHGIAYLHEDCYPRVIHRDIKSLNILLDNSFEALVSDFGLAKIAMDAKSHVTTRVVGTFGYMAPEYASSGKLTEKSDVFSFGVVLLELITGRKPVDTSQPAGHESLVEWARPLLSQVLENKEFETVADPKLKNDYVNSEMFRMIEAAAACVRHSSLKRPKMGQVVRALDNMATVDLTNGMRVGESGFFNEEVTLLHKMAFDPGDSSEFFRRDLL